jgi:hypothetical protein
LFQGLTLQHPLHQRQIGSQPLKSGVLFLKVLRPARMIEVKTPVLPTPAMKASLRNPGSPTRNLRRLASAHRNFNPTEQHHNLPRDEPVLGHIQAPFQIGF